MNLDDLKTTAARLLGNTRQFVENGMRVLPTAFIIRDQRVDIAGIPFNCETKQLVILMVALFSEQPDVEGVIWINDAWTVKATEYHESLPISEHPTRTEALTIDIYVKGDLATCGSQPYSRADRIITWCELKWNDTN